MKIGFSLPHMGPIATPQNIGKAAKFADSEGFDSVWVIDRILWPKEPQTPYPPSPDGSWPTIYQRVYDPIETLTYVAGITKRVQLATGIIDMLYQNPLILANRLATLDNLSEGRLFLGLGLGHSKDEFQAAGVPFEKRGQRADEFLKVLDTIWYNGDVEFSGDFYSVPKSVIEPKPFQRKIPIHLAGFSPKALERIITADAQGWVGIPQLDMNGFKTGQSQLRKFAKDSGRDPNSIEFPVLLFPDVTEQSLGEDRVMMNGNVSQIAQDIIELESLGVNHVNLVFDFGPESQNLEKRLSYAKQIREAILKR